MFQKEKNSFLTTFLLPILGGALFASSFPSKLVHSYFLSGIIGVALFFYSLKLDNLESTFKMTIIKTLFFSLGFTLLGYYWIPQTIEIFGDLPLWAGVTLGILFSFIALLQWPVALSAFFLIKHYLISSDNFKKGQYTVLLFSILLTISEYISPQQFPTHLGHIWLHLSPYLFWAPYIGEIGYSFISYWLLFSLIFSVKRSRVPYPAIILAVIFLSINFIIPLENKYEKKAAQSIQLRLVQANIGSLLKVGAERGAVSSFQTVFERYERLSLKSSTKQIDLLVWPETAYPETLYSNILSKQNFVPPLIKKITSSLHTSFLMGGYDLASQKRGGTNGEFNTAFLFNSDGQLKQFYHKRKLIPFGEGLPFGPLNHLLKKVVTNISYFSAGNKFTNFSLGNDVYFITPICYEILFSSYLKSYLSSTTTYPNFILNLTNDSWYGDTSEPYQHLFLAQWRSLEFQIPLVRMTNTGITSITYPDGSESKRLLPYKEGILDISLPIIKASPTYYQTFGIYSLMGLWVLIYLFQFILGFFESKKR